MYTEDNIQLEADREQPYNSNAFNFQREIEEANRKAAERMQKKREEEQIRQEAWEQGIDVYELLKKKEQEDAEARLYVEQMKQEEKLQQEKDFLRTISETTWQKESAKV